MTNEEIYIELTNIRDYMKRKDAVFGYGQIEDLIVKIEREQDSEQSPEQVSVDAIGMLPYVAKKIIEARDAHIQGDYEDAWHALYSIASPDFSSLEPWAELEEFADKAT